MKKDKNSINVIFDMDGTLVDSIRITLPAFKKICPKFGIGIPSEDTVKAAIGYASPTFYYKIFPDIDKTMISEFGREVEQAERDFVSDIGADMLFDGIDELLECLKKRGYKMYVASTGGVKHVNTCLNACSIFSYFREIHCDQPNKEQMVADIIVNAHNDTWIMIGDRKKDSNAAKHNNITGVAAAYGYCDIVDYGEFDYVLKRPDDLLKLIDELK